MSSQEKKKYIPLHSDENAVLHDASTLLPRDEIYKPLADLIRQARDRAVNSNGKSLNKERVHNAISIDGARGTGKTAVLVNLKFYLELEHSDLLSDVHILEPIDPTLLEDGESLFLHIIVAAVLHDDGVKQAQRNKPEQSRALNQALDKLAHSLEAVETQKERYGMDKVRAMYGNKQLADSVHEFFLETVKLLDRKLLVLPIDDVDTSLNLAFENLEIIRRYLTTPYVLPIVSGDRGLYHEVTWRDFHGRLTKDSRHLSNSAYGTALELAEEYQRKVLPFPRRKTMPDVSSYWQWEKAITLGKADDAMPLANFISWLEIFLTGPVNGQEDSRFPLPIPSIRALTQLISHCSTFIPDLPNALRSAKREVEVRRLWQMPTVPLEAMDDFQKKHSELGEEKREYGEAYKLFADKIAKLPAVDYSYDKLKRAQITEKLAEYFRFEPKAGAIYLILLAKEYWQDWSAPVSRTHQGCIFDTPLFQPLEHNQSNLSVFEKTENLSAWSGALANRLPPDWLADINSQKTILPYPVAEVGINSSTGWDYANEIMLRELDDLNLDKKNKAIFLISMLVQKNFYTNAKQTMLLNIGRIFELIIASVAGPVTQEDLSAILNRAPFFSTRALAPTKTLLIDDDKTNEHGNADKDELDEDPLRPLITKLHGEIETWRSDHRVDQIDLSPWLVYKVFNKVYSQVASNDKFSSGMQDIGTAINILARTFYATWSAFGSFEKGDVFGLPNVVATTNLNSEKLKNFENNDHFNTNIRPFAPTTLQIKNGGESYQTRSKYGKSTRSIAYCLAEYPLKKWIDEIMEIEWSSPKPVLAGINNKTKPAKQWLCEKLNMSVPSSLTVKKVADALANKSIDECNNLRREMVKIYKANERALITLNKAIGQKRPELA